MKTLLACVFVSGAFFELRAAPIFYDSFNYSPAGTQLSSAGSPSWVLRPAGATVDPKIISGSLSYPGLQTASGDNGVVFDGTGAAGVASRQLGQIYTISNAPALYYSLTFQVGNITAADWGGAQNFLTGSFMMGFNSDATAAVGQLNTAAPLLIRTGDPNNVTGTANDFPSFQLGTGVTATSPGSRVFDGAHNYDAGTTLFLVLSYTFGPGATDDTARLFVNPIPGSLESANTPVVTATGAADVTNNQIQTFFLRNNSVEPAGTLIDDLRVGSSWGDVTPLAVPEPSSVALAAFCAVGLLLPRRSRR